MYKISETDLLFLLKKAYTVGLLNPQWDLKDVDNFLQKLIYDWINNENQSNDNR